MFLSILYLTGLAKEYVVPGWRVGWVCIHDAPIRTQAYSETQLNIPKYEHELTLLQKCYDVNGTASNLPSNSDVIETVMSGCESKDARTVREKDSVNECKKVLSAVSSDVERSKSRGEGIVEDLTDDKRKKEISELYNVSDKNKNINSQRKREISSTMSGIKSPNCNNGMIVYNTANINGKKEMQERSGKAEWDLHNTNSHSHSHSQSNEQNHTVVHAALIGKENNFDFGSYNSSYIDIYNDHTNRNNEGKDCDINDNDFQDRSSSSYNNTSISVLDTQSPTLSFNGGNDDDNNGNDISKNDKNIIHNYNQCSYNHNYGSNGNKSNNNNDIIDKNNNNNRINNNDNENYSIVDTNKINLKDFHMNGSVDIDALLIQFIHHNKTNHTSSFPTSLSSTLLDTEFNIGNIVQQTEAIQEKTIAASNMKKDSKDDKKGRITKLTDQKSCYKNGHSEGSKKADSRSPQNINETNSVRISLQERTDVVPIPGQLFEVRKGLRNLSQLTLGAYILASSHTSLLLYRNNSFFLLLSLSILFTTILFLTSLNSVI